MGGDEQRRKNEWWRARGFVPPADLVRIKLMLFTFLRREGETEQEWKQRLSDRNQAFMDELDEREAKDEYDE